ncbi:MAG: Hpt domain-containing protein [Tissierellales bacterium]|nr:Hpt domain-containing protein [Tissierellales bacterium]
MNKVKIDIDFEELIPTFLENRRKDCVYLRKLLEKRDYEEMRKLGHSIKGVGYNYGFDVIGDLGKKLEEVVSVKNDLKIKEIASDIENYIENIDIEFIEN